MQLPSCIRQIGDGARLQPIAPAQRDIATLFRVLRRYHLEDQRERSTAPALRGVQDPVVHADTAAMHWVECALELLDDYRESGLLRYERRTTDRIPRGRIDWRTTIRREFASFSEDTSLYLTPFRCTVEAVQNHPLTELHAETIRQLCKLFATESGVEVPEWAARAITRGTAMQTLTRERNRLYRDRERRVVKLLEQYWLGAVVGRTEGFRGKLLWTDQFEFIWQRMAERVLSDGRVDDHVLPRGRYYEDGSESPGLYLRPDLVVDVQGGTRIIFDAKYYTSCPMPASGDLLKQLAYSYFSSSRWAQSLPKRVLNIFLLPADSRRDSVRLSGRHRFLQLNSEQKSLPMADDIWLFRIDYRTLADSYLSGSRWGCGQFLDQIRRALEAS